MCIAKMTSACLYFRQFSVHTRTIIVWMIYEKIIFRQWIKPFKKNPDNIIKNNNNVNEKNGTIETIHS